MPDLIMPDLTDLTVDASHRQGYASVRKASGMKSTATANQILRFRDYEVDLETGRLQKHGVRVNLREKSFQVLAFLLERPGELVTREELRQRLWPEDVFVDFENNLNAAVARLREALHDSADQPRFIETLPKRGYRFIGELEQPAPEVDAAYTPIRRLVVLPFVNLSGDLTQEYLSDAITEEIITEIGGAAPGQLAVIARTTAMSYKGRRKDVTRIGRELDVNHVVEGSVRQSDQRIVITAQLIEVSSQDHVWAQRYDIGPGDLYPTERDIAGAIAAHLGVALEETPAKLKQKMPATRDPQAHFLYMQGRYYFNQRTPAGIVKARECFEQAMAKDPEYALVYDSLAELLWAVGFLGYMAPKEAFSAGVYAAMRALELDPSLGETHALLGMYRKELDYNWPEVQREMMLGFELKPSSPVVRYRYALSGLIPQGRLEESIDQLQRALEDDPMSLDMRWWLAEVYDLARQYDLGLAQIQIVLDLDPYSFSGHFVAGHLYRDKGMGREAVASFARACELTDDSALCLGWLGQVRAISGDTDGGRAILGRLHALREQSYVPASGIGWIHLGLGEVDEAFRWLDRAIEERDPMIIPIKTYPFLDPIRTDARYLALLRKMKLEP